MAKKSPKKKAAPKGKAAPKKKAVAKKKNPPKKAAPKKKAPTKKKAAKTRGGDKVHGLIKWRAICTDCDWRAGITHVSSDAAIDYGVNKHGDKKGHVIDARSV